MGITLGKQGKNEEAVESFRKAISINPKLDEAHFNMGLALGKLGRLDEAMLSFRQAI
jgi:Flp pilus assembly protein TadD